MRPERWHPVYAVVKCLIKLSALIWKPDNELNELVVLGVANRISVA